MKILRVSAVTVASITMMTITVLAQSASELRTKYGPPMDAYEVRPNILVTVQYTKDGEVDEYVIESRHNSRKGSSAESLISPKTAREVIDELAPVAQRGAHLSTGSFNSGCNELAFGVKFAPGDEPVGLVVKLADSSAELARGVCSCLG